MKTSTLSRKIYWAFVLTCLVFIFYGLISQIIYGEKIFEFLRMFRRNIFLGICFINISYLFRYFRWRYLVYKIGFKPSLKKDFINWASSFAFSTTPGKIGELIRIDFYNKDFNIPKSKTLSILIIEKISDLVSIFMISFLSFYFVGNFKYVNIINLFLLIFIFLFLLVIYQKKFIKKLFINFVPEVKNKWLEEIFKSFQDLIKKDVLFISIAVGTIAWFIECCCLYLLVNYLNKYDISIFQSTFAHATSTLVGAISLIPAGIGATEFTTSQILVKFGIGLDYSIISSFIIRLITIWYATILGFLMLFIRFFRKNK